MTQVLVVGSPGDSPELQAQLSSLSDRCAVVIGPYVTSTVLALADALDAIGPGESVALVGGALVAADEVLLRLIDDPQLRLGALVQNRARTLATQGSVILSAATSHHLVVDPDATFLDGIYVASQYVARVAHVLREHASEFPSDDALSAALSVLSRDEQLPAMTAVRSEPFPATALGSEAAQVRAELTVLDPLLGARYSARPGDGFYS